MNFRTTLLRLHRWVAIATSALLLIIAISGMITVFAPAYERLQHPELLLVTPTSARQPLDSLLSVVRTVAVPSLIIVPRDADESVQMFGLNAERKPAVTYINPYTAQLLGTRTIAEQQAGAMLRIRLLHRTLLQGKAGGRVVGIVTLLSIFMALSGLVLWWPRKIVRVSRRASGARFNFDLHNSVGVLSSALLLFLSLTGAAIYYPSVRGLVQRLDPPFEETPEFPAPEDGSQPLTLDSLVTVLRAAVPGGQPAAITLPRDGNGVISMGVRLPGEAPNATRSRIFIDRYNGQVIRFDTPHPHGDGQRPSEVRLVVSMLHTGVLYGWVTSLLVLLGATGQVVLIITGLIIWGKRTWRTLRSKMQKQPDGPQQPISVVVAVTAIAVLLIPLLPATLQSQSTATVTMAVRDSITGSAVADATVEVRSAKVTKSARSNAAGAAQIAGLAPETYAISILRIGYRPRVLTVLVGLRDTTVNVLVEALPTEIAKFQVRSNTQEIFGIVGAMPGPHAVVGAKVQIGAGFPTLKTDTAGHFIFRDLKPGKYTLRISAAGFKDRLKLIDLPAGTSFESSHLLDSGRGNSPTQTLAWNNMQDRVRWRGFNSALVSSDELQRFTGNLASALSRTQEVAAKGLLRPGTDGGCVYVNGRKALPGVRLDHFDAQEVAFVEVYDVSGPARKTAKARGEVSCSGAVWLWLK